MAESKPHNTSTRFDLTVQRDRAKQRRTFAQSLVRQALSDPNAYRLRSRRARRTATWATVLTPTSSRLSTSTSRRSRHGLPRNRMTLLALATRNCSRRWLQKLSTVQGQGGVEMQFANRADDRRFRHDEATLTREQRAEESAAES